MTRKYEELVFHVFTLGISLLGWHKVPTGFVPSPSLGAEPVSKPVSAWIWVPDVNTLIYPVTNIKKINLRI